ncbi:GD18669 [Drosophila simulans]|uniref:GD18669 n=1 Tax=Drosophila simulans TaxID=7240 RepID=B4QVU2_DROSI|nr:GD18669 [Drosophila simulans]
MSEENYLWRPHMASPAAPAPVAPAAGPSSLAMQPGYFHHHQQQLQQQQQHQQPHQQHHQQYATRSSLEGASFNKSHFDGTKNNFEQIPAGQSSVSSPIYVEDETIVLTEDEDETVVSSHDYNEYATDTEEVNEGDDETQQVQVSDNGDDDEEEVFVDVLGSDDDEDEAVDPVATRLQAQLIETTALKRNELLYEDEELHNQAGGGELRQHGNLISDSSVQLSGDKSKGLDGTLYRPLARPLQPPTTTTHLGTKIPEEAKPKTQLQSTSTQCSLLPPLLHSPTSVSVWPIAVGQLQCSFPHRVGNNERKSQGPTANEQSIDPQLNS